MKNFINEFKEFALKGNAFEMAVGIIIGAAFTAIVTSLVDDIISPLIGLFVKVDFNHLVANVMGVDIKYGAFIMAIIDMSISRSKGQPVSTRAKAALIISLVTCFFWMMITASARS